MICRINQFVMLIAVVLTGSETGRRETLTMGTDRAHAARDVRQVGPLDKWKEHREDGKGIILGYASPHLAYPGASC